jgi:lysozyme family protein
MDGESDGEPREIAVLAYSERYAAAVDRLLGIEGGYVNDPKDRGGATKLGISLRFLEAEGAFDADGDGRADFDLDMDGDIDGEDVRQLTRGDAIYLYHKCFWLRLQADTLPRPIGEMVFDQAVNGGLTAARKLLQRALNDCLAQVHAPAIAEDGAIGSSTRAALNAVLGDPRLGTAALVVAFREAVRDRYHAIAARNPSQRRFLAGWLHRADQLGRA